MKNINILLYIASPIKSIEMTRIYCKKKNNKVSIDHFCIFTIMYVIKPQRYHRFYVLGCVRSADTKDDRTTGRYIHTVMYVKLFATRDS